LTITGSAIALQSGATGDVVSVRNVDSGRIIKGTIGSDGAVHVGGP
jgi:flagella basal body P-ring formation protein FlgA